MDDSFLHTTLPVLGNRVHRLGLACNFGIDNEGIEAALGERGLGLVFWTPKQKGGEALKQAMKRKREDVVLVSGPTTAHWKGNLTRYVEKLLKRFDIESLDVLMAFWVGVTSSLSDARLREMEDLRQSGKVRAIGCSIHDRQRAGELVADSPLDVLMIRYNAAHPGAEQDIFPHINPERPRVILAYTATRWRKLLSRPRGWDGPVMSAADCYRFCLSNPHVHAVLNGPKSLAMLDENLEGLQKGPLEASEAEWMRDFGRAVRGK
ncbi:MAG: aldo/keto reductase [Myxococcota bacterium]|nr:aldo/keto reductase [Myxococcota bacterium]